MTHMQTELLKAPVHGGLSCKHGDVPRPRHGEYRGRGTGVHLPLFLLSGLRQGLLDLLRYPVTPRVLGELAGQGHVVLHD